MVVGNRRLSGTEDGKERGDGVPLPVKDSTRPEASNEAFQLPLEN